MIRPLGSLAFLLILIPSLARADFDARTLSSVIRTVTQSVDAFDDNASNESRKQLPEYGHTPKPKQVDNAGKVEVFVASRCPHCVQLENYLREKRIEYIRYDLEKNKAAEKDYFYNIGRGGILPVTRVGDDFVRGFDPQRVDSLVLRNERPTTNSPHALKSVPATMSGRLDALRDSKAKLESIDRQYTNLRVQKHPDFYRMRNEVDLNIEKIEAITGQSSRSRTSQLSKSLVDYADSILVEAKTFIAKENARLAELAEEHALVAKKAAADKRAAAERDRKQREALASRESARVDRAQAWKQALANDTRPLKRPSGVSDNDILVFDARNVFLGKRAGQSNYSIITPDSIFFDINPKTGELSSPLIAFGEANNVLAFTKENCRGKAVLATVAAEASINHFLPGMRIENLAFLSPRKDFFLHEKGWKFKVDPEAANLGPYNDIRFFRVKRKVELPIKLRSKTHGSKRHQLICKNAEMIVSQGPSGPFSNDVFELTPYIPPWGNSAVIALPLSAHIARDLTSPH